MAPARAISWTRRPKPNPQTAYAECKALVERDVGAMAGRDFCARVPAQRDRLRTVAAHALRYRVERPLRARLDDARIAMVSDGSPWRPLVHVLDICEAIYRSLVAPDDAVRGKIFNVGQDSENYRVREIAEIVASEFPGLRGERGSAERATIAATA